VYCLKCDQLCYEAKRRHHRKRCSGSPPNPQDFRQRFYAEIESLMRAGLKPTVDRPDTARGYDQPDLRIRPHPANSGETSKCIFPYSAKELELLTAEMLHLKQFGLRNVDLAEKYQCSPQTIGRFLSGKTYRWVV
jgi:hypothetical protein